MKDQPEGSGYARADTEKCLEIFQPYATLLPEVGSVVSLLSDLMPNRMKGKDLHDATVESIHVERVVIHSMLSTPGLLRHI